MEENPLQTCVCTCTCLVTTWKSPQLHISIDRALVPNREMVFSVSSVVEGFGFSPQVISSEGSANNAVRRAPEADRENNLVVERSLLASAAYEQLNSMESSRLVYLYNLDPPGDPWCRTLNSWRQHCFQCSSSSSVRRTGNCWVLYHFFYDRQAPLFLLLPLFHHCTV